MPRNTKTKKTVRRTNLPQETLERARAELRGEPIGAVEVPTMPAPAGARPAAAKPSVATAAKSRRAGSTTLASRRIPTLDELLTDYRYVMHDLRNLAVLAGTLLIVIVAAALLLSRSG